MAKYYHNRHGKLLRQDDQRTRAGKATTRSSSPRPGDSQQRNPARKKKANPASCWLALNQRAGHCKTATNELDALEKELRRARAAVSAEAMSKAVEKDMGRLTLQLGTLETQHIDIA